jgi:hypothetical protein
MKGDENDCGRGRKQMAGENDFLKENLLLITLGGV